MDTQIKATPDLTVIKEQEIPHILLPGEVGAVLELIVTDKDGKVTEKRVMKSESFVRQFLELLWVHFGQINPTSAYPVSYNIRDTSNTLRAIYYSGYSWRANAGAGVTTFGIIVGTGSAAPTIDDYVLQTPIAHGVGAGQLQYSAVTFGAPASDSTTSQFTITRNFANGSGGAITVNEIGLYVNAYFHNTQVNVMTIRDVIAGGIAVPNGQTLTINYRLQAAI